VQDGKLTPAGLAEVKARMPHADFSEFEKDPELEKMSRLFTVDMVVNFVEGKLRTPAA
jgi:acyl carrier protein